jgi:hypothetical protein
MRLVAIVVPIVLLVWFIVEAIRYRQSSHEDI